MGGSELHGVENLLIVDFRSSADHAWLGHIDPASPPQPPREMLE